MAGRAGPATVVAALLAIAAAAWPGRARPADPPAAESQVVPGRPGLLCLWAIYATVAEVGRSCGGARNAPLEAELGRTVLRLEDYARRQAPEQAVFMADYRARRIEADAQLCTADALALSGEIARATPTALRGDTDRLLGSSPPVEWGACL